MEVPPGRGWYWSFNTEAQSMGLFWTMIWILTKDYYFDLREETGL